MNAAIDFTHLDRFTGGDHALNAEVLRLFRTQTADLLALLQATDDPRIYAETAHGLKGAARAVGAWTAAELAALVEPLGTADPAERAEALSRLSDAFAAAHAVAELYERSPPEL